MESHPENRKDGNLIALVRHGSYRVQTGELDDLGVLQSKAVATALSKNGTWTEVVASPTPRTSETGRIIADQLGIPFRTDHAWMNVNEKRESVSGTIYVSHLPILQSIVPEWDAKIGAVKIVSR
jgi:phosphohistidine phosphatase SixA